MPDLTLDEFRDIPKEKLEQLLRNEARYFNLSGLKGNNLPKKAGVPERLFKQLRDYSQRFLKST